MMLTRSRPTPAFLADFTTLRPSAVRPSGSTGRVSEIFRPGLAFCRAASAVERRAIVVRSATAAPSMSRSMYLRPYAETTAWYSAWSAETLVQAWASSMPVAPPKDTFTSPPAARTAAIWSANCFCRGSKALNQLALQPALVTKARLNDLRFPLLPSWASVVEPFESKPMSTYGATSTLLPPGAEVVGAVVVGAVVGGLVVGAVVGALVVGAVVGVVVGFVVAGVVGAVVAPPEQGAPLIVQLVGAPLPATTNPNSALPPAGIVLAQL